MGSEVGKAEGGQIAPLVAFDMPVAGRHNPVSPMAYHKTRGWRREREETNLTDVGKDHLHDPLVLTTQNVPSTLEDISVKLHL